MKTFKELIEAKIKKDLISMAPHAAGEQNFVDQQTVNKNFSDKFLLPDNGVFDAAKNVKVYNRKANRFGRDTDQSITDYDKGDMKTESENLTEFWFNKNGHFRKITKRNTHHARHIVVDGKIIATTDAGTNKEAIKHFLATSTGGIAKSKIKVESLQEKQFEVGKKVHAGLATKGGAGYVGVIKEVGKDHLKIHIGSSKFGDRVVKAHKSVCTLEASGASEMEQIYEAISNPNSSGQGHDDNHLDHPLHGTLEKYGYEYSHSTPIKRDHYIAAGGEFKQAPSYTAHSYFHGDTDHCCSINSDSYKWHTKTSPASGRVTSGEGAITLDRHLRNKAKRFALNNPVVDATEVNPAHNSDNVIHASIRDDGIHNDADNAIHAGIHHRDDVVGENIKESHWIQKAVSKHPGALTRKAKREGVSNSEFEQEHKGDSGTTGKEARLAITLKKMHESMEMTATPENDKEPTFSMTHHKFDRGVMNYHLSNLGGHIAEKKYGPYHVHVHNKETGEKYHARVSAIGGINGPNKIKEHLDASEGANKYIDDFVHSTDSRFEGKSKKERIKMALGAYYGAKKSNESVEQPSEKDKPKKKEEKKDDGKRHQLFDRLLKSKGMREEINEALARGTQTKFADSKGKMKEDRSKIDSKNDKIDKIDKVKEFIAKRRGK